MALITSRQAGAPLSGCPVCGSNRFFAHESELWLCTAYPDGALSCTNPDTAIDAIACEACGAEYAESDFAQIAFS